MSEPNPLTSSMRSIAQHLERIRGDLDEQIAYQRSLEEGEEAVFAGILHENLDEVTTGSDMPLTPWQMQPKVGYIVNYQLVPGTGTNGNDLCPALIDRVHALHCVDLIVYPDFAPPFRVRSVLQHQNGHSTCGRAWSWP